jgi:hypothetical protein
MIAVVIAAVVATIATVLLFQIQVRQDKEFIERINNPWQTN